MTISVNPANILDVLALLLRRKKERKEKVVEYVESIATEADSLADVWQKVFTELAAGRTVSPQEDPIIAREINKYAQPNAPHYRRLWEFYHWVSVALGDKLETPYRETLVNHLGHLLRFRDLTMESFRAAITQLEHRDDRSLFVLDSGNANIDLKDLAQLISALQKEAAALHVLAKTIHAMN